MDHAVRIWATIDRLTKPTQVKLERDLTSTETGHAATCLYGIVPSLWRQAVGAICGRDGELTGPGGDPSERDPYDLALWEICVRIRETTADELRHLRQPATGYTETDLRRLAATVVSRCLDLEMWDWRFMFWTGRLETHLGMLSRANKPVLLRNSSCPECGIRVVTTDKDDGRRIIEPALEVTFHNGYARAILCRACGAQWGRGEPMHELALALA